MPTPKKKKLIKQTKNKEGVAKKQPPRMPTKQEFNDAIDEAFMENLDCDLEEIQYLNERDVIENDDEC